MNDEAGERLSTALELSEFVALARWARLQRQYPGESEEEIARRFSAEVRAGHVPPPGQVVGSPERWSRVAPA
ncbi:MAG: hypothetical protein HY875_14365 [Chloroflexi bacterium]|nr:hypothetical protein [Chloroflexota bacterium]